MEPSREAPERADVADQIFGTERIERLIDRIDSAMARRPPGRSKS